MAANFLIAHDPEYNCGKCKKKYKGDTERQDKHQRLKGCYSEQSHIVAQSKNSKLFPDIPVIRFTKCPANWTDASYLSLMSMYHEFKNGINHYGIAPADTPAKYYEVMSFIDTLFKNHTEVTKETVQKLQKMRQGVSRGKK